MQNIKEINIKNRTYYFFDDMINIKDIDSNLLKIDKKGYKNSDIFYIGYIAIKDSDYVKINGVNPLYLIVGKLDGHIEETLVFTDRNNKVLIKYTKLWDKIKNLIKTILGGEADDHGKDFTKIKLNSDDNLPLNKILKLHRMTIVIKSGFQEDGQYYPQVF